MDSNCWLSHDLRRNCCNHVRNGYSNLDWRNCHFTWNSGNGLWRLNSGRRAITTFKNINLTLHESSSPIVISNSSTMSMPWWAKDRSNPEKSFSRQEYGPKDASSNSNISTPSKHIKLQCGLIIFGPYNLLNQGPCSRMFSFTLMSLLQNQKTFICTKIIQLSRL